MSYSWLLRTQCVNWLSKSFCHPWNTTYYYYYYTTKRLKVVIRWRKKPVIFRDHWNWNRQSGKNFNFLAQIVTKKKKEKSWWIFFKFTWFRIKMSLHRQETDPMFINLNTSRSVPLQRVLSWFLIVLLQSGFRFSWNLRWMNFKTFAPWNRVHYHTKGWESLI